MLLTISQAARILGTCTKTLRRWHASGRLLPDFITPGGHRRYDLGRLEALLQVGGKEARAKGGPSAIPDLPVALPRRAAIYARVSARKQDGDLTRQVAYLEAQARAAGFSQVVLYKDVASGLNDARHGIKRLIRDALARQVDAVFITHRDRLARFGTALIQHVLDLLVIPLHVVGPVRDDAREDHSPTAALVDDVLAILTSYSGKLYRLRRSTFTPEPASLDARA